MKAFALRLANSRTFWLSLFWVQVGCILLDLGGAAVSFTATPSRIGSGIFAVAAAGWNGLFAWGSRAMAQFINKKKQEDIIQ